MYIVEAQPRTGFGKAGNVLDGKTLIYMDSEMWFEPYIDTYDRQGALWTNHIYYLTNRDRPVPTRALLSIRSSGRSWWELFPPICRVVWPRCAICRDRNA